MFNLSSISCDLEFSLIGKLYFNIKSSKEEAFKNTKI